MEPRISGTFVKYNHFPRSLRFFRISGTLPKRNFRNMERFSLGPRTKLPLIRGTYLALFCFK